MGEQQAVGAQAEEKRPSLSEETGAGAARRAALGNAQHVVDGDVVGRDKLVFLLGGENPERLRRLSPLLSERVRNAFVTPDNWDALREQFKKRKIVVLRGGSGQGRTATAIRLLMSVSVPVIYELDARVDLDRLVEQLTRELSDSSAVEAQAAFLLSQPVDMTTVQGRILRGLDEVFARTGGRLVLTVGRDARLPDEDAMGYLVELPAGPDLREIVNRHLEWRLADRGAEQWMAEQKIVDIIDELLAEIDTCQRAALLAQVISEDVEEGVEAISPARIRGRMARYHLDDFDTWFAELGDVWTHSFAIALAVLDGLPYEDVARAAEKLTRRLEPPAAAIVERADDPARDRHRHFQRPRRLLLERVRATVVEKDIWRPYGRIRGEVVAYKDVSYPHQVLLHAWLQHHVHDVLLDWLTELVEEPSDPVLVQTASALGVLSTCSFHHLLTKVVGGWARDEEPWKREAVAYLLRVPAADARLGPVVRGLVDRWLGADDDELRATAIRTLGLSWLSVEPAPSAVKLEHVARDASLTVIDAIARSFIDLLEVDAERFTPGVLTTLVAWFDRRETIESASLVFLWIAHDVVSDLSPAPGAATVRWPGLLRLAIASEAVRDPLVRCWCQTIARGSYTEIAEQVIDGWAGLAEQDQAALDAFTRLSWAIGSADPRGRTILLRSAQRWRNSTTLFPLPRTAAAVESVLDPGRTP